MRLKGLLRRVRHLSIISVWAIIYRQVRWTRASPKHIKIDDEERQLDEFNSRSRHPLVAMIRLLFLLTIILAVALCLGYIIYKPPKLVIDYFQSKYPDIIFQFPLAVSQRVVSLTLDDAPSSETAMMLNHLKTYGAKATFFVIGNQISKYPELIKRIHDEGHEIGIHGWADEPSYKLSLLELEQQIKEIESLLPQNLDGGKWFRPGSGWFSKPMVQKLKNLGYTTVLGSIYPHDPQIPHPRINAANVLSMLRSGAVIIMHDRRPYSAKQLELVLKGLASGGWRSETVGGLQRIANRWEHSG